MSSLECQGFEAPLELAVSGCRSWVDLQLSPALHHHLAQCKSCTTRTQQLLEVERRLWELQEEELPDWDLSASVMARLSALPVEEMAPQPQMSRLVWAPLLLVLGVFLPDPGGIPNGVGVLSEWLTTCWTFVAMEFALDWHWSWPSAPMMGDGVLWAVLVLAVWSAWSLAPRKESLT